MEQIEDITNMLTNLRSTIDFAGFTLLAEEALGIIFTTSSRYEAMTPNS